MGNVDEYSNACNNEYTHSSAPMSILIWVMLMSIAMRVIMSIPIHNE